MLQVLKFCFACNTKKSIADFSSDRYNKKDGLATCCTKCNNELYKRMDQRVIYIAKNKIDYSAKKLRKAEQTMRDNIQEEILIKAKLERAEALAEAIAKRLIL